MSLKSSILNEVNLLMEKRIAQIFSSIEVSFSFDLINSKGHVTQRMSGRDIPGYDNTPVTNAEITEFVYEFRNDIAQKIAYHEITDNTPFVIRSVTRKLAIPVKPVLKGNGSWELIVLTVWRETPQNRLKTFKGQVIIQK